MTITNPSHPSHEDLVPIAAGPAAIQEWFASAGLAAILVERCPDPSCPVCSAALADAA